MSVETKKTATKSESELPAAVLQRIEQRGHAYEDRLVAGMRTLITPKARTAVQAMPEYHPPLASRAMLRLDFNENTLAPNPRVFAKLQSLTAEGLTIYPEREPREMQVATHYGLQASEVLLTNGVDEAIHLLACAFLDPDDEVLLCTPSFLHV